MATQVQAQHCTAQLCRIQNAPDSSEFIGVAASTKPMRPNLGCVRRLSSKLERFHHCFWLTSLGAQVCRICFGLRSSERCQTNLFKSLRLYQRRFDNSLEADSFQKTRLSIQARHYCLFCHAPPCHNHFQHLSSIRHPNLSEDSSFISLDGKCPVAARRGTKAGEELSTEIPPRLAARVSTSKKTAKTESTKAQNGCL